MNPITKKKQKKNNIWFLAVVVVLCAGVFFSNTNTAYASNITLKNHL